MTQDDLAAVDGALGDSTADREGDDAATRLVRRFLRLCESPLTRDRMLRLVQASIDDAGSAQRFYGFLNKRMSGMLGRRRSVHLSTSRVELVGSQLVGVAVLRYVLKVDPVASMSIDELVPMVAAGVRGVLRSEPALVESAGPSAAGVEASTDVITSIKATGRPL